jgi:hypothetical protein
MHQRKLVCWLSATIILLTGLLLAIPSQTVSALGREPYLVDTYDIDIKIQPDGTAAVTERVLYSFEEDTDFLDFYVNQKRMSRLTVNSVAVSENNPPADVFEKSLQNDQIQLQELSPSTNSENMSVPMSYVLSGTDNAEKLRLRAFFEGGSKRLIKFEYLLEGLVRRSVDSSFIKQEIVGIPGNVPINCMKLKYTLPYNLEKADSWLRIISEISYSSEQIKSDQWMIGWEQINSGQVIDAVLIMPYEAFALVSPGISQPTRSELISEAEEQIDKVEQNRFWLGSIRALVFFLLGLSLVLLLLIYLIFDREGVSKFKGRYLMPESLDYPPAILSILMRSGKPGLLLFSTLIDLVRRGELELDGLVFTWKNSQRNDYTGFKAFEIFLLQWLFGQIGKGNTISTVQIRDYARDRDTSEEFNGYFDQFRQLISEEMPQFDLIDQTKSRYGKIIGISLSVAYLIMGVASSILLKSWIGVLLLIPAVLFFIYGLSLRHLTVNGNEQFARGKAIKRYLGRFFEISELEKSNIELPECKRFVSVLPYAIALNRTKLFMRQMLLMVKSKSMCGTELIEAYQSLSAKSAVRPEDENLLTEEGGLSPAAKAASVEQLRLLGRDLVAMESMLLACFYFSSKLYLIDDH